MNDMLPQGWVTVPLKSVGRWSGGGTPSKAEPRYWTNGTIPWVSPKDMKIATLHDAEDHITEDAVTESTTRVIESGSVLIVTRSGILQRILPVALNAVPVALNQDMKAITPNEGVDARYLYWMLVWLGDEILRTCTKGGTTVASVEMSRLYDVPVPLAPLAAQRRIVAALEEHLSALDSAVSGLERAKVSLRRLEAAELMAAVCYKFGGDVRVEEPEPWALPPSWRWVTVDSVGDVLLGRQRAPQYLTGRHSKPYLRVANVGDDILKLDDVKRMDFDEQHAVRYGLQAGDILVSEGQSPELVGQSAIYRGEIPGVCFQKTLHRFRARPNRVMPEYAQLVFRAYVKGGVFQRYASLTVNIAHLTLERFKRVPFPLPPLSEQQVMVDEATRRAAIIARTSADLELQLVRAARLRQSILHRAFSGGLVPQDPADELASFEPEPGRANRSSAPTSPPAARGRARTGRAGQRRG